MFANKCYVRPIKNGLGIESYALLLTMGNINIELQIYCRLTDVYKMPIKKSTSNHRFFPMFMIYISWIQCSHSDERAQLSCHWRLCTYCVLLLLLLKFPVLKFAVCYVTTRQISLATCIGTLNILIFFIHNVCQNLGVYMSVCVCMCVLVCMCVRARTRLLMLGSVCARVRGCQRLCMWLRLSVWVRARDGMRVWLCVIARLPR